jgi:hypothetical protein
MPQERIPELIDEQDVADLLNREADIIDRCDKRDLTAQLHLSGAAMARATELHLRLCYARVADVPYPEFRQQAEQLLTLIDYQVQLRAHHLDFLEGLEPA